MRSIDFLIILFFLVIVLISSSFVYQFYAAGFQGYREYKTDVDFNISGKIQFYSNMRYKDKEIKYSFDPFCSKKRMEDIDRAFLLLEDKTILKFIKVGEYADIEVLCSDIVPEIEERGHYVAGEGGPSEVIQAGIYNVILHGKISLFRNERCESPQIALHEILHALGFDHNSDKNSILYPITECNQIIDLYILDKIESLYSLDSVPDLIVDEFRVAGSGRYINLKISVLNGGFMDSGESVLKIYADDKEIKEINSKGIEIGTRRIFDVENLRLPLGNLNKISVVVFYENRELGKQNNMAEIKLD